MIRKLLIFLLLPSVCFASRLTCDPYPIGQVSYFSVTIDGVHTANIGPVPFQYCPSDYEEFDYDVRNLPNGWHSITIIAVKKDGEKSEAGEFRYRKSRTGQITVSETWEYQ